VRSRSAEERARRDLMEQQIADITDVCNGDLRLMQVFVMQQLVIMVAAVHNNDPKGTAWQLRKMVEDAANAVESGEIEIE
jgi:hypothetical protein